jgi:hypothetical protein
MSIYPVVIVPSINARTHVAGLSRPPSHRGHGASLLSFAIAPWHHPLLQVILVCVSAKILTVEVMLGFPMFRHDAGLGDTLLLTYPSFHVDDSTARF